MEPETPPTDPAAAAPATAAPPQEDPGIRQALEHRAKLADQYEGSLKRLRDTDPQAFAYVTARLTGDAAERPAPASHRDAPEEEPQIDPEIQKYVSRAIEQGVQAQVQAIRAQLGALQNKAAVDDVGKQLDRVKAEILASGGDEAAFQKIGQEVERLLTETPVLAKAPNAVYTLAMAADRERLKTARSAPTTAAGPSPEMQALRARIRGLPGRTTAVNTPAPNAPRTRTIEEVMDIALAKANAES